MEQLNISNRIIFLLIIGALISIVYGAKDSHYWGILPKTANEILLEVGSGISDPSKINLSPDQFEEITNIIKKKPTEFNDAQKSLISKQSYPEKSSNDLLTEVGLGKTEPKNILLTPTQFIEILDLIKKNPDKYNNSQKALLYVNRSAEEVLKAVDTQIFGHDDFKLTYYQRKEIKSLIDKTPLEYNEFQKSLFSELSGSDILYEIGMGKIDLKELKISAKQRKEIEKLIKEYPLNYNEVQKSLLNEK